MSKVFIGMPVYNGERFINEAIISLLNQSFQDWKLFISDDCSNDNTGKIVQEFTKMDTRITYHRQIKNIGLYANFKFVLDKANSSHFMWAAQDDIREKNYLKVCVNKLDNNKNLGFATTVMAAIDSFGRTLIEEKDLLLLSGKPGFLNVARYTLQPEILGKCNLMYGLFRTSAAKATWAAYPQRHVWGQDYMFSLALISRFEIYVDSKTLFKKRLGGISSPDALTGDAKDKFTKLEYKQPKNLMFPFGRFRSYFWGHMEALNGTKYRYLVAILLITRLPRALIIHIKERKLRNFIKRKIGIK